MQLFVDRVALVRPDFRLTDRNAPSIASICRRLDGIPLAIELAAARMRSLSAEEINRRLDQRFRLLTGGSRTALPRQQTLRSLIDWSYDLLTGSEQALLRRLSVLAGGWSLDSAAAVAGGNPIEEWRSSISWHRSSTSPWWSPMPLAPRPATGCWRRHGSTPSRSCGGAASGAAAAASQST